MLRTHHSAAKHHIHPHAPKLLQMRYITNTVPLNLKELQKLISDAGGNSKQHETQLASPYMQPHPELMQRQLRLHMYMKRWPYPLLSPRLEAHYHGADLPLLAAALCQPRHPAPAGVQAQGVRAPTCRGLHSRVQASHLAGCGGQCSQATHTPCHLLTPHPRRCIASLRIRSS